jgi:hypothetical protein
LAFFSCPRPTSTSRRLRPPRREACHPDIIFPSIRHRTSVQFYIETIHLGACLPSSWLLKNPAAERGCLPQPWTISRAPPYHRHMSGRTGEMRPSIIFITTILTFKIPIYEGDWRSQRSTRFPSDGKLEMRLVSSWIFSLGALRVVTAQPRPRISHTFHPEINSDVILGIISEPSSSLG